MPLPSSKSQNPTVKRQTYSCSNANPVTWNPFSGGPIPYRGGANETDSNGTSFVEYIFDNHEFTISGAPSVGLPEALKQWNAPNGTGSHLANWEQDDGGSMGLRRGIRRK